MRVRGHKHARLCALDTRTVRIYKVLLTMAIVQGSALVYRALLLGLSCFAMTQVSAECDCIACTDQASPSARGSTDISPTSSCSWGQVMAVSLSVKSMMAVRIYSLFFLTISVTIICDRWPRCLHQIVLGFDPVLHRDISHRCELRYPLWNFRQSVHYGANHVQEFDVGLPSGVRH